MKQWGMAVAGILISSGLALQSWAQPSSVCTANPHVWSEAMTAQLPLYANLELARVEGRYRVLLVSVPEVVQLTSDDLLLLGVTDPDEDVFELYFSTIERRLAKEGSVEIPSAETFEGRRTDTLNLAYRAYVTRSTRQPQWRLFSLQVKAESIPTRDISEGAIAQAIRAWQRSGCPRPSDLELSSGSPQF